jgi:hypothetical protein
MPRPRARPDACGPALPREVLPGQEAQGDAAANRALRRELVTMLATTYAPAFRRGIYASVQMTVLVENGQATGAVDVQITRHHRRKDD